MTHRHSGEPARPSVQTRRRRIDESMALLVDIERAPVDPGYLEAAAHRRQHGAPRLAVAVMAILIGVTVAAGAMTLRTPQPEAIAARSLLEKQIEERQGVVDDLQTRLGTLSTEVAALQAAALSASDNGLIEQVDHDSAIAGGTDVTGPGLKVTMNDAPGDRGSNDPDSRVQDIDLQIVVNGLWEAGAEAIAVNGKRLTATTAIRAAGDAILVDVTPLVPPYVIEAIGDADEMEPALARGAAGQHLALLKATYGIDVSTSGASSLHLATAGAALLRSAVVPEDTVVWTPKQTSPSVPSGLRSTATNQE